MKLHVGGNPRFISYFKQRHHAPGQVHLLTQRAGSPGVLTAGAIPRVPSPAGALTTSQPHAIQESLRYCIRHNFRVQIFSRFWTRCGKSSRA